MRYRLRNSCVANPVLPSVPTRPKRSFPRFKIPPEVFSASLCELVFAGCASHAPEYSLISDIHSSPLTDGVITSSAGISAIGHHRPVRFPPRVPRKNWSATALLTLLINFPLPLPLSPSRTLFLPRTFSSLYFFGSSNFDRSRRATAEISATFRRKTDKRENTVKRYYPL